nr:retrovirus-related Pol polyprotein from transposon TNT 1-94 [Tanacetum cinerariifolium]
MIIHSKDVTFLTGAGFMIVYQDLCIKRRNVELIPVRYLTCSPKDLKNVEVKIDNEDATIILLVSLPPLFENFVNFFVVGKDTITLEDVRSNLHSRELPQPVGLSATGHDRDLKNVEVKIDNEDATIILLVSLPPLFENFVNSFVVGKDTSTLEDVRSNLHSRELPQPVGLSATGVLDLKGFKYKNENGVLCVSKAALVVMKETKGMVILSKRELFDNHKVASLEFCEHCVIENKSGEEKLDSRGKKGIFMVYDDGVKGYQIWSPSERRVILSRDVTFDDDYLFHLKQDPVESKLDLDSRFGFKDYVTYALQVAEEVESIEPATYREVITSKESDMWIESMGEEIESLHKKNTWELVKLPQIRKVVSLKWVFKKKAGLPGSDIIRSKARLVAKGYSQKEGINYNEIFYHVVRHISIFVLLSLVAHHDSELEQLDVKTAFLHGDLEEEIYMSQPEGFVVQGKEDYVYVGLIYGSDREYLVVGYSNLDYVADLDARRSLTALTEKAKEGIWLKGLIEDLGFPQDKATVFCDNMSAICLAKDQVYHDRTKYIDVPYHFIHTERRFKVKKIGTQDNHADVFTKLVSLSKKKNIEGKLTLVDDDGKPLLKVVSTENADSDRKVEDVVDDHAVFMVSTGLKRGDDSGYGTNWLLKK